MTGCDHLIQEFHTKKNNVTTNFPDTEVSSDEKGVRLETPEDVVATFHGSETLVHNKPLESAVYIREDCVRQGASTNDCGVVILYNLGFCS